jgi:TonB family protein
MRFWIVLLAAAIVSAGVSLAQSRNDTHPQQEASAQQTEALKPLSMPPPAYPDEARKKGIEGKVILRIVIDEKGHVSQATAVNGPPELIPAAVGAAKMWEFEPAASAPSVHTAEVSFGFPKECPGPVSDSGEVVGK